MSEEWEYRAVLVVTTKDGKEFKANVQTLNPIGATEANMLVCFCNESIRRSRLEEEKLKIE